jgi:hypothetical protein
MRKMTWNYLSVFVLGLALAALPQAGSRAADKAKLVTVKTILEVTYAIQESEPPNLVVTAVGQVNSGEYKDVKLTRVKYTKPPKDGIQEYVLSAVPPSGAAIQVISKVTATDTWKAYKKEAPWIKGIRVKGAGDGVVVKKFARGK